MGLLSSLRKLNKHKDRDLRILFLGLNKAGKTSILKLVTNDDPVTSTTQGVNVKVLQKEGLMMTIIDVAGQKDMRAYWRNYFDGTDVLVFVVDASDTKRLEEATAAFFDALEESKLNKVPVLILANKKDQKGAISEAQVKRSFEVEDLTDREWKVQMSSAVGKGDGIQEGLEWTLKHSN